MNAPHGPRSSRTSDIATSARERGGHVERAADRVAQRGVLAGAEHDAQDHVERQRLHARHACAVGAPGRQPSSSACASSAIVSAPARERVAVERRAAAAGAGAGARGRAARGSSVGPANGSSTVELEPPCSVPIRGEDAPDRLRVGHEHHRRVRPRDADRERLAVARLAAAQQRGRAGDPLDRLQRERLARSGRQRHAAHCRASASRAGWRPPKPDSTACQWPTAGSSSSQHR